MQLPRYDYKPCENLGQMAGNYNYDSVMDVQWPFGFGLSYTTYVYNNLKVDKTSFTAEDELTISVDVTNTGKVAGKEAVCCSQKIWWQVVLLIIFVCVILRRYT